MRVRWILLLFFVASGCRDTCRDAGARFQAEASRQDWALFFPESPVNSGSGPPVIRDGVIEWIASTGRTSVVARGPQLPSGLAVRTDLDRVVVTGLRQLDVRELSSGDLLASYSTASPSETLSCPMISAPDRILFVRELGGSSTIMSGSVEDGSLDVKVVVEGVARQGCSDPQLQRVVWISTDGAPVVADFGSGEPSLKRFGNADGYRLLSASLASSGDMFLAWDRDGGEVVSVDLPTGKRRVVLTSRYFSQFYGFSPDDKWWLALKARGTHRDLVATEMISGCEVRLAVPWHDRFVPAQVEWTSRTP